MIVVLHDIRSLHNVGSIFRTADAAGIEKIYLGGITPAPIDQFSKYRSQLTKVSLGAEKYVAWEQIKSTTKLIDKLKKDGYRIFAIEQNKESIPYYNIRRSSNIIVSSGFRIALVLGSETKGLSPAVLKRADKILEIPMRGAIIRQTHHPRHVGQGKESLNVSVAFGIIVFSLLNLNK